MNDSDISLEQYALLSDDDKKKYYMNADVNTRTHKVTYSYGSWDARYKRAEEYKND